MSQALRGRAVRAAGPLIAAGFVAGLMAAVPGVGARALGPSDCPWKLHLDANTTNVAFPDQNANYYTLAMSSALINSLTITGAFPHARYMSFTTYTGQTQAIDGINDVHIVPATGNMADNPFLVGHARNTSGSVRNYAVIVAHDMKPMAGAQTNTIYTTDADGSHSNLATFIVIYRTYRPDARYPNDGGGGEPLPTVTANTAAGPQPVGDPSTCSTAPDQSLGLNPILTDTTLPLPPIAQVGCYPGLNPPAWHRFTNIATAEIQGTDNTCLMDNNPQNSFTDTTDTKIPPGGFLENPDNKYIAAILNVDFFPSEGQPNVLVVRSRVPTTPDTYPNTSVMPAGQLRYWSMCSNEGITTRFYACVMDDGLTRLNAAGDYCLAVSRTSDRPRNANGKHNVNWLPFGVFHDNVLIERNMLPDSSFGPAIQNVAPGNEKALGVYYPASTYMTVAAFEAKGCPGFANSTAFGTQPGDLPTTNLPTTSGQGPVAVVALAGLGLILVLAGGLRRIRAKAVRIGKA